MQYRFLDFRKKFEIHVTKSKHYKLNHAKPNKELLIFFHQIINLPRLTNACERCRFEAQEVVKEKKVKKRKKASPWASPTLPEKKHPHCKSSYLDVPGS